MITLIGAGNIAWHLAKGFEAVGFTVDEIYSREITDAEEIANELYHAGATDSLDFSASESELFVLAVSDNAIAKVAAELTLPPGSIVVHVSGAMPLSVLDEIFQESSDVTCGVFYPLMTFTKYKPTALSEVPFCIESSDKASEAYLLRTAKKVSRHARVVTSEQRLILHLGAVFACNFTNHLLAISQDILEVNELDFDLLRPIVIETVRKGLAAEHAADVQTGPAIRHDSQTLKKHEDMLEDDPELKSLYQKLTYSIQTFFA